VNTRSRALWQNLPMSKLHLAQIRRHLKECYVPGLDLEGAEQEHHQLSRALAALALAGRAGLAAGTAAKSVTDHSEDGGIDGAAFAADRSTLVLAQSKWNESGTSGLQKGDLLKFIDGVRKLVANDWSQFGGPLARRRAEIEDILSQPGTRLELVVAHSGTSEIAAAQLQALNSFCAEMNDSTEIASWIYLNQERLYRAVALASNQQITLGVNLRNWGSYQEAGCLAYYGTASAQQIVEWYQIHGSLLFSRNIRGALSDSSVNEEVLSTAREDPTRFWFFNNGITVS
jgi:hypothetical protein